jgi:Aerobic-type carbon monoxide dehydrogenase, large subunit CoxL/CutL homologs
VVEVDTETGQTDVLRYVAVDDCGVVINPMIVDGQVQGGVAQGIAEALYEEAVYDESGNLMTSSMTQYLIPSAMEIPDMILDRTETPSTANALGVKGIAEAGTIASPPAVINAVVDALSHLGVTEMGQAGVPRTRLASDPGGDQGDRPE